jgi:hypothetical protein
MMTCVIVIRNIFGPFESSCGKGLGTSRPSGCTRRITGRRKQLSVRPKVCIEQPGAFLADFREHFLWIFTRSGPHIPFFFFFWKSGRNERTFTRKRTHSYCHLVTVPTTADYGYCVYLACQDCCGCANTPVAFRSAGIC